MASSPKYLNIVVYTSSLHWGGAETHLIRLANEWQSVGHTVHIVLAEVGGAYESRLNPKIEIIGVNKRGKSESTINLLLSFFLLRKVLKQKSPDIIYSVMDHANIIAILTKLSVKKSPLLFTSIQNTISKKYKYNTSLIGKIVYLLIPILYRYSDCIIPCSNGVAKDMVKMFSHLKKSYHVIYNAGFDDNQKNNESLIALKESKKRFQIAACGRLIVQKDFATLIKAVSLLKKEIDFHLTIIGGGPLLESLLNLVYSLGLNDYVTITGFVDNPSKYLLKADVFVLSSIFEGCSLVITEAMSLGLPVISTNCECGPNEIISNKVNGILVPTGNHNAIYKELLYIHNNPDYKSLISHNAQNDVQKRHPKIIASKHIELFKSYIKQYT